MRVYKTLMKLYRRNYAVILPLVIFMFIFLFISYTTSDSGANNVDAKNYRIAIINEDGSDLSNALEEYMKREFRYDAGIDTRENLKDALFYARIDNGIVIPKGFSENYKVEEYNYTSFASSFIVSNTVNSYVNSYLSFKAAMNEDEAIKKTVELLEREVETISKVSKKKSDVINSFKRFVTMFSYIIMIVIINSLYSIYDFDKKEIKKRILSSNITNKQVQRQIIASMITVSIILFLFSILLTVIFFGFETTTSRIGLMIFGRLLLHIITLTSIAYLINSFVTSQRILGMVGNFLSLSFAFLGGVFLPIKYVSKGVLMFSKLIPTYWFTTGADEIISSGTFNNVVMKGVYIETIMIIAFLAAAFSIRVEKRRRAI